MVISKNEEFKKILNSQFEVYKMINDKTAEIMKEHSKQPGATSPIFIKKSP
ncbi:MAG: hypothetical protein MUO60_00765 [Clostridiaceae bacterium]|nr:hypothetical protein [Clostridiaceae bacterium]